MEIKRFVSLDPRRRTHFPRRRTQNEPGLSLRRSRAVLVALWFRGWVLCMYATPGRLQQVGVGFDGAFGREHGLAQREGQFAARGIEVASAVEEFLGHAVAGEVVHRAE